MVFMVYFPEVVDLSMRGTQTQFLTFYLRGDTLSLYEIYACDYRFIGDL